MKKLFTLGALLIALATASPALADHGQSSDHSILSVQVGSGNVSPAVSANAPANVDAPVCVAAACADRDGAQDDGGASAEATTGSGSSEPADQSAAESIGTVQVGSVTVDPAAAVAAPVNANAPVCVAAACSSSSDGRQAGSTSATTTSGSSQTGRQSSHRSIGTVQVGSVAVDPAAAVSAPVNANAPVCVLASCSSRSGGRQSGPVSTTTNGPGQSRPADQSGDESIGTVQIGSIGVDPAAAVSTPIGADAPACVLSTCTAATGGGDNPGGGNDPGGGDNPGDGDNPGGGGNPGGPTGDQPVTPPTPPTTSPTGTPPGSGQTGTTGSAGTVGNGAGQPGTSGSAGTGAGSTAAGQGVRGAENGSTTSGRLLSSVAATGELPFSGLELAKDLVLGLSLLAAGLFARALSRAERRRR